MGRRLSPASAAGPRRGHRGAGSRPRGSPRRLSEDSPAELPIRTGKRFDVVGVTDTTAAGEVSDRALLAGLLWRWTISAILRLAYAVAALKCRCLGGCAGIPTLAETRAFLGGRGAEPPPIP